MKIRCRACGYGGVFDVVSPVNVTAEISEDGSQIGGAAFANDAGPKSILCPQCGNAWRTKRHIEIVVDVR